MKIEISEIFYNRLLELADEYSEEEFDAYDRFGGNMDDSYLGGYDDGQVALAKEIVEHVRGHE